jgi:hypothetical protein
LEVELQGNEMKLSSCEVRSTMCNEQLYEQRWSEEHVKWAIVKQGAAK